MTVQEFSNTGFRKGDIVKYQGKEYPIIGIQWDEMLFIIQRFEDSVSYVRCEHCQYIPVVDESLLSVEYLMQLHPLLDYQDAENLLTYCVENTIRHKECYGDGSIMYPKWQEQKV